MYIIHYMCGITICQCITLYLSHLKTMAAFIDKDEIEMGSNKNDGFPLLNYQSTLARFKTERSLKNIIF